MANFLYRNARLFVLAVLVIVSLGATTLLTIGRQEDPTITNLFATIVTPFPGADPGRVEALVTVPIEEALQELPEIDEIASSSGTGVSVVTIALSDFLADDRIEGVWSKVRDALADARRTFPEGAGEPAFDSDRTGAFTLIAAVRAKDGIEASRGVVRRYALDLQERLRSLPGTKLARLYGEGTEEVRVTVDPDRLTAAGITANDVAAALRDADAKVGAGRVRGGAADLLIEVSGEIDGLDRVRAVPLIEAPDGPVLRVGDVAQVERALNEPAASLAYADGAPAVLVAARMVEGLQVDAYAKTARGLIDEASAALPDGLEVDLLFDQSAYTAERLGDLGINLLIGVGLVVLILGVTLGVRAALVVAGVIPLTGLLSLFVLGSLGVPIHQMSVTGLIVALGLLVDGAIVMTDEVRQRLARGLARAEAVAGSVRRLAVPLLASTATTVLAFMPMALLPGPAGDFVGSIALAVIVMLIVAFVLALGMTSALAGWLVPDRGGSGRFWDSGLAAGPLAKPFAASIDLALKHRGAGIAFALVLPLAGFLAFPSLTAQFFPGVERDQFYVQLDLADGASLDATAAAARAAGAVLKARDGIERVHWVVGENAPAFYYNMVTDRDGTARFAEALVTTASPEATAAAVPAVQRALDLALPNARVLVRDLVQGPPVGAPVELRLQGPDLDALKDAGETVRGAMAGIATITHATTTLAGGAPKLVFDLDEDKVTRSGLDLGAVAGQLAAALEGAVGGSLIEGTETMPVRVRLDDEGRGTIGAGRGLDVVAPGGGEAWPGVPLAALGTARIVPAEGAIPRLDGERINAVRGYTAYGILPEEALAEVRARLDAIGFAPPPGVRLGLGGDSDARGETVDNLLGTVGLVVTLTLATIVLTFNSFRLSLIAVLVMGLSFGLSFLALAVFGYPFGIQALIGSIGSIGVSVNAAIIVMTALQEDEAAMAGDSGAMRDVVVRASRHIVSTTLTTFAGFLPLILAGGGFWPPFAMAIAGGVLLSIVLSFYFTPPMFALLLRRQSAAGATVVPPAGAA